MAGGPRRCAVQSAPAPLPAAPGTHSTTTARTQTLTGCPVHPQWGQSSQWQSPHVRLRPPQALRMVQCSVLPCATAAKGKGVLGVTAPSCPRPEQGPREGAHPWPGVPWHPRARERLHLPSQQPRPWGAAGRGYRSSRSSRFPGQSRSPGVIFGSASLPSPGCRSCHAQHPRTPTRVPPPRWAAPLPAPHASPAPPAPGAAHRFASRRCR